MAITYSIASNPIWYIADISGKPLAAGFMATYSSLMPNNQKLVYKTEGNQFPWPYIPITNNTGLTGILFNENGSQGPFYFQFDSANPDDGYFIEIYDNQGVLQWTVDNFFPSTGSGGGSTTEGINLINLVTNNVMYRNIGQTADPIGATYLPVAPGAHSGLALTPAQAGPDIVFRKNITGAIDQLTFTNFTPGTYPLATDVTPNQFLNYTCGNSLTGELYKHIQFPITAKLQSLSNKAVTITIWARANSGNTTLTLQLRQFFGDGGGSADVLTAAAPITLTSNWTQYQAIVTIPSINGLTLGACGNDALFLQVEYPLNVACNIDFTKPSMYIGQLAPDYEYQTYDMIDGVMNVPRTGDVDISFNYSGPNFVPGGWVMMNDGSIGNATTLNSSNASTRANQDTFPLYNLLWNAIPSTYCPMVNNAGMPTIRGASAIADFTGFNAILLPKGLGRVLSGADPAGVNFAKVFAATGNDLVVNDSAPFYTGTQCTVSNVGGALPSGLAPATTYFVIIIDLVTMQLATSLANAEVGAFIPLGSTGSGTNTITATLPAHPLASYVGEDSHALLISEMPSHIHTLGPSAVLTGSGTPGGTISTAASIIQTNSATIPETLISGSTNATGGSAAHNNLQPTVYANYLIKL